MAIHPLHDNVVIKREETEVTSAGGIILSSKDTTKSTRGTVLYVGKGIHDAQGKLIPMEVKVGDKVIFNEGYNTKVEKLDDQEVIIISEKNILAIVS